ncbi:MAG: aldo/keto reductase [Polyangiaceae bacterium]
MNQKQQTSGKTVELGGGTQVFPLALGCMGMSGMYGDSDEAESTRTIHAALERGVTVFDTGDFYGQGHNEMLLGRALAGVLREQRERVLLSVKFGALRGPDGAWLGMDMRPAAVKNFCAYSLKRLGVDYIDIYRPARLDGSVPIEDTIGAIAELVKAGYVRSIGLSEVGVETIRRAQAVHPIVDLQIEYSLVSRGPERQIFPALRELGIGITAYGLLSRGLLTGSKPTGKGDFRAYLPRFAGENGERNRPLVEALERMAKARGTNSAALAVAWALAKEPRLVAVVGARKVAQLDSAFDALSPKLALSATEIAELEAAVPAEQVVGERYQAQQMAHLDSER